MRVTTPDPLIGKVFAGRYRIERKLGTGGMATVYLAEDQELGRRVAIKMLDDRHAQDEQFVERFRREAKSAAGLSHPNIVAIFDRGEAEGTYYIVMEYLEGRTLKELLVTRGPTPVRVALDYARQILAALENAHREGIVHRDIKPHNVVVRGDGRLKVTDFGIARSGTSEMTEAGSIIGTAQYLSPEQAKGEPVSPASDLYSVGIVLYEMLTGSVPFTGDTPLEIAMKHLSAAPKPPSAINPKVPHDLDSVVLRALAKSPAQRYASAGEMDADLTRVARGLPVAPATEEAATAILSGAQVEAATQVVARRPAPSAARTPPPYSRGPGRYYSYTEPVRRRPLWPWLLAVLLLAAAGFAGYYVYAKIERELSSGKEVTVPFVRGQVERLAVANVRRVGLVPRVRYLPNASKPVGIVFEQMPNGGDRAPKGNTVTLVVSTGKPKTTVPDVRGKTLSQAISLLSQANLHVHAVQVHSTSSPGTVTGQYPPPGTRVVVDDTVRINISQGLATVPVPSVDGQSPSEATATLQEAGFVVSVQEVTSATVPKGEVVGTAPIAGTQLQRGETVTLEVSKGPETVTVPSVTDLDVASAKAALAAAGFKALVTREPTTDPSLDGVVSSQTPDAGTQAPPGTTVALTVETYQAPPPAPPPPPPPTPPQTAPADTAPTDTTPTDTAPPDTTSTDTTPGAPPVLP